MKNMNVKNFVGLYDNPIVLESRNGKHLDGINTGKWEPVTIGKRIKGKAYFYKSEKKKFDKALEISFQNYEVIIQRNDYYKGYFLVIIQH